MRPTFRLGRIAGIPVGAHWSALVTLALLGELIGAGALPVWAPGYSPVAYGLSGAGAALLFLLSLLVHEFAHALMAIRFGLRVEGITIWLLGGTTRFASEPMAARPELLIAVAGPAASGAIGVLWWGAAFLAGVLGAPVLVTFSLGWLAVANLVMTVFNLLPGTPLDGGRILRAILWMRGGDRDAASARAAKAGQSLGMLMLGLAMLLILWGYLVDGLWLGMVGWFLSSAAAASGRQDRLRGLLRNVRVEQIMSESGQTAPGWFTTQAFVDQLDYRQRQRVFPVLDFTGQPVGVISLADVAAVPEAQRLTRRVADVARPLSAIVVAKPDSPVLDLLATPQRLGRDLILVLDQGKLVGAVSADDLARTVELAVARGGEPDRTLNEITGR